MEIAKLIRERRLELGLTMKQLGQKAGASESAVSRWEAGETDNMKRTNIVKVADALHISPLAFLGYDISDKKTVKIPIVGRVVAGTPISMCWRDYKSLPRTMIGIETGIDVGTSQGDFQ